MKVSGYKITDEDKVLPEPLAEVTLDATPDELRRMAAFRSFWADEMDRMGSAYDHVHLSDQMEGVRGVASLRRHAGIDRPLTRTR